MAQRLIDGTKATKDVMEYSRKLHEAGNVDAAGYVMWAASIVDNSPTIDPVKHGKWMSYYDDDEHELIYYCSECGHRPVVIGDLNEEDTYCSVCGARMDGE